MIVLLDTSTATCKLTLVEGERRSNSEWEAGRQLAKGLLAYLRDQLAADGAAFGGITGVGVFSGPGSFTGLRIGLTVFNTLADAQQIPIIGACGDDWQDVALRRLRAGENDRIVLPYYGAEANITVPRK